MDKYIFPSNIDDKPFIDIESKRHDTNATEFSIILPIPQGFTISDGHGFGNLDLGIVGKAGSDIIEGIMSGQRSGSPNEADIEKMFGDNKDANSRFLMSQAFSNFGIGGGVTDRIRNIYGAKKGIASNPNTVLQYQAPEIRTYALQFRIIPSSQTEANRLKIMIAKMREATYPDTSGQSDLLLLYPNKWKFSFGGKVENFLPPSYDCYCTNLSVTYNTNTNIFFEDGSPADVTIQLSLRESKSLVKGDIKTLHSTMGIK